MGIHIQRHHSARATNRKRRLVPEQIDLGLWPEAVRKPLRPEINQKLLREVFDQRMLNASLFAQSTDEEMAFTARMVLSALSAVRDELKRRIS